MQKKDNFFLTQQGLKNLKIELKQLEEIKRPQLVKRIIEARSMGDLAENSEYASAREELAMLDGKIEEIKNIISKAKTIKKTSSKKRVSLGCKVSLKVGNKVFVYEVVGEWEANPLKQKISHNSPLGKALVGKKIGDKVEVEAPAGKIVYEIQKIY